MRPPRGPCHACSEATEHICAACEAMGMLTFVCPRPECRELHERRANAESSFPPPRIAETD